ncbi:integrase [Gemmobacter aquarius]|uniref:Integrase n=2 Tax=Paragemmobacter aquarius TaxID=2169400 RepID=A0A2S0UM18_9RHOB|nr:integrase [Gemmobacter aquarius]
MVRRPKAKPLEPWTPDGRRWYVRRAGKYFRISGTHGTEEFDRAYWDIINGRTAGRTSWAELVKAYRAGDRWLSLKTRTRADYEQVLEYILERNGTKDATKTRRADVLAALEANRHRVRFANLLRTVLVVLLEVSIDLGWQTENAARGARPLKMPKDRQAPHLPWTDEAVALWREKAEPLPRLIFELGVGSVQRPADWCRFKWSDYDGERLELVQGKTDKALSLPCTAELRAALDAAKAAAGGNPKGAILRKRDGDPMSYRPLAWVMLQERKRLGLEAFDLHALRYRGIMELAWSGCDDEEIQAYSGHNSRAMVVKYAGLARQVMRSDTAATKRANRYGTKKDVIRETIRLDGDGEKT